MVIPKYAFNIGDTWQVANIRKGSDFFGLDASRSSVGPISDVAKNLNALPKSIARVIQQILIYVATDRPIADRFIHDEMKAASLRKNLQAPFDRTMIRIPLSGQFCCPRYGSVSDGIWLLIHVTRSVFPEASVFDVAVGEIAGEITSSI